MEKNQNIDEIIFSVPRLDQAFRNLFENEIFPDCIIHCIADNVKIQAHKRYLCGKSTFFDSEFGSDIKERNEIRIDATSRIFVKLLDYLYTSTIDEDLSFADTQELLRVSHFYHFAELKSRMSGLLIKSITPSNVCHLSQLALLYQAQLLRRTTARYIAKHLKEVEANTPKWKALVDSQVVRSVKSQQQRRHHQNQYYLFNSHPFPH